MPKVVGVLVLLFGLATLAGGVWLASSPARLFATGLTSSATILRVTAQEISTSTGGGRRSAPSYTTHVRLLDAECSLMGNWGSEGDAVSVRYAAGAPSHCIRNSPMELVMPLCVMAAGLVPIWIALWLLRGKRDASAPT